MRRSPLLVLAALALLPALAATAPAPDPAAAQDRDRARRRAPRPQLVAHEWGVWLLEDGRPSLADLAAESPPFVVRAADAPSTPPPTPQVTDRPVIARKPVLFLRSDAPIADLQVEVDFHGGRPWLLYPRGQVDGARVAWRGSLRPSGSGLPAAPPAHWWRALRAAGGHVFTSTHGGAERFLFYDGPVRFRSPVDGRRLRSRRGNHVVWRVEGEQAIEHRVTPQGGQPVRRLPLAAFRRTLRDAATEAGLSEAEVNALLETWQGELFEADAPRVVHFLPREDYDRMLPLRIRPAPAELVRVGLVIERL